MFILSSKKLFWGVGLFFALPLFSVFAQTIQNPIAANSFEDLVNGIADFALLIVIPISVIVILYAGALFMTSAGDVEKVKKAKRALLWALVGLGIVLIGKGFILIIKDVLGGGARGTGQPELF